MPDPMAELDGNRGRLSSMSRVVDAQCPLASNRVTMMDGPGRVDEVIGCDRCVACVECDLRFYVSTPFLDSGDEAFFQPTRWI